MLSKITTVLTEKPVNSAMIPITTITPMKIKTQTINRKCAITFKKDIVHMDKAANLLTQRMRIITITQTTTTKKDSELTTTTSVPKKYAELT